MAGVATMSLHGDKQLMRALREMPAKIEKRVVKKALAAGAKVVIPVARQYAVAGGSNRPSRRLGNLRRSIGMRRARQKHKGTFLITVGPRYQRRVVRRIGKIYKSGRRKMVIKIASAKESAATLKHMKDGKKTRKIAGIKITNPGKIAFIVEFGHTTPGGKVVPPRPFMRPAFEATKGQVERKIKEILWQGIREEARKANAKSKA